MGGHVQMEYINWATAPPQIPAQDYFEFRRLRLLAEGTGYGVYDFRLQMTLEPESIGESPIGNVTTPEVCDAVREGIDDEHWFIRGNAMAAAGHLRLQPEVFVPLISSRLNDEEGCDWTPSESAITALGEYGPLAEQALLKLEALRDEVDAEDERRSTIDLAISRIRRDDLDGKG
jgi:hypothetical protein